MPEPEKKREEKKEPKVNVEVSRLLFDILREQEEIQRREARVAAKGAKCRTPGGKA